MRTTEGRRFIFNNYLTANYINLESNNNFNVLNVNPVSNDNISMPVIDCVSEPEKSNSVNETDTLEKAKNNQLIKSTRLSILLVLSLIHI